MRIHCFQHVEFETPAFLSMWAQGNGHSLTRSLLYAGDNPAAARDFDVLAILGGPMNIYEHDRYPWLSREKEAIRAAIDGNKFVLGICLGGQLVADALGAAVTRNIHKEIGWMPVARETDVASLRPFDVFPARYMAFHWHGDTFGLPPGAVLAGSTEACKNQGFLYKERVVGLQYHLEATRESANNLVDKCGDELVHAPHIHDADRIRRDTARYCGEANTLFKRMLDRWLEP